MQLKIEIEMALETYWQTDILYDITRVQVTR